MAQNFEYEALNEEVNDLGQTENSRTGKILF